MLVGRCYSPQINYKKSCHVLFNKKLTIKKIVWISVSRQITIHVSLNFESMLGNSYSRSINGFFLLCLLGSMQFYLYKSKENNNINDTHILVHISEFLFKIQTVAIHHHCRRVSLLVCRRVLLSVCYYVLGLLSLKCDFKISFLSLCLFQAHRYLVFAIFLFDFSLSFSISSFSFAWFSLSFCSFPSKRSLDESDPPNQRTETNGFDRPFGRQRERNLFTRLERVEWRFDPKLNPTQPVDNPILTIPLGINSLTSHTLLQGVILEIVIGTRGFEFRIP